MTCGPPDPGTFYDFAIGANTDAVHLDVSGGEWIVTYRYINKVQTAWGVNAHGQSYGIEKDGAGSPDLLAVVGMADDGSPIDGYAFASQLKDGPQPSSPSDAATYSQRLKEQYPNEIPVPVYKPDRTTRIGTFFVAT